MEGQSREADARRRLEAFKGAVRRGPPTHLDLPLLEELERSPASGEALASSQEAESLLISPALCERWLASADGRGLIVRDQTDQTPRGGTWRLTERGGTRLNELREGQKLVPRPLWSPFARAASEGVLLAIKTFVAAVPVALIAWWWGLIDVTSWWGPVISAVAALLLGGVGLVTLLRRRERAVLAPVLGQEAELQRLGEETRLSQAWADAVIDEMLAQSREWEAEYEAQRKESASLDARFEELRLRIEGPES